MKHNGSFISEECLKYVYVWITLFYIVLVKQECDKASGLILLISGSTSVDGSILMNNGSKEVLISIEKIWNKFYTYQCPELKNKPKIFIFDVSYYIHF